MPVTAFAKLLCFSLVASAGFAAEALGSASAVADVTKDQCIDANAKAQELRRDGKLAAAREQLRTCMAPSCPSIVRDDCTKRLDDLERAQPTVAFEVKDAAGTDLTAVTVSVDGTLLADRLAGTALPVDIGEHVFTFEVAGQAPVSRTLVITEGEKGRRESIVIGSTNAVPPVAAPAPPTQAPAPVVTQAPPAHPPTTSASVVPATPAPSAIPAASSGGGLGTGQVVGLAGAGVGVVGLTVGTVFGLMAIAEKNQQVEACATSSCTPSGHSQATSDRSKGITDATVSTVGFIAGGVLLAGGAALFLTGGRGSERPGAGGMTLLPSIGRDGGGLAVRGEF
jgi:hypothetical protein